MFSKSVRIYLCVLAALLTGFLFFRYFKSPAAELALKQEEFKKVSDVQHSSVADYIFLRDGKDQEWVYKQITDTSPDDQIVIVLEAVASEIARAVNIPINQVRIISGDHHFEHRLLAHYPGSLHLKVPGECVEESPPWADFDIHQNFRSPFLIARKGPLPPEEIGLKREVIRNMAKHPDLPKIAALDTYLGNMDRSNPNLFYDKNTDAFYGIDMGNSLMGNLAQCALEKLQEFFAQNTTFSKEERLGLQQYRQVLSSLVSQFPPAAVIVLLDRALEEAGFVSTNPLLWNEDTERKLRKWKLMIEENYNSSVKLVDLLEKTL